MDEISIVGLIFYLLEGVASYLIFKPSYVSRWKQITAQDEHSSRVIFHHSLREIPIKVQAEVKVNIDGKDYIFNAQGSAQIDDDNEGKYGGVICLYNETTVELFAPFGRDKKHGGIVYTGGQGWTGALPSNTSLFTSGNVRVKAWKKWDFRREAFFRNWTNVGVKDIKHFYEFKHGLEAYPDYVIVQVKGAWQNYVMEAQGSISILQQYKTDTVVGGVMFGYSKDRIRVWIPQPYKNSTVSTVNLMFNADGWVNSDWWIYEAEGQIRIYAWILKHSPRLEFSGSASSIDFGLPLPLVNSTVDIESKFVLVETEVLDGSNSGYRFQAVGTTFNDGWYGAYGGLIYALERNNVLLWIPDASPNGYIFHLHPGGLFGNRGTYQKSNNVIVRVTVFDENTIDDIRCPIDQLVNKFQNLTNGTVQVFGNKYRDVYTAECRPGFRYVSGKRAGRCRRQGVWSLTGKDNRIQCEEILCPEPPDVENAISNKYGNRLDDVTVYQCNEGFVMNDASLNVSRCLQNSTWSTELPTCLRMSCSDEDLGVLFADINITGTQFGGTVTYQCQQGYPHLRGDLKRVCQNKGTWSGIKPVCKFCSCFCRINKTTPSNETLTEMLDEMRKEMTVESTNTSKARRKKISVKDNRPSARGIGAIGVALLVVVLASVLIPDVPRLVIDVRQGLHNICCTSKA